MSCTVMYQPYAMSYSSCDRSSSEKHKLFKFPTAPSPPDSLHSDASSYNSPGPLSVGGSSGASATVTGATVSSAAGASSQSQSSQGQQSRRPLTPASNATITSARGASSSSSSTSGLTTVGSSSGSGGGGSSSSTIAATATATSSSSSSDGHQQSSVSHSHRAHYLSANCVVFVHYHGDVSRVVDEHFSRALSAAYSTDKSTKCSPMSTRNFPPSFWNSSYKPLTSYGAEFYGATVDYGSPIPGLAHHHQTDPWHYPLPPHQSYHHRPTEIPYPPMPSSSRFNAAQYGSFLLAGAAAGSGAGRFPGMPTASQCGVKGESGAWGSGRYHPHDTLSDLHLADYSAAAAAHYSNMTAGLETSVQDSSKDLYWF